LRFFNIRNTRWFMATQKSWLQRCLTPKIELPGKLVLGAGGLCWLLVFGLWAGLAVDVPADAGRRARRRRPSGR